MNFMVFSKREVVLSWIVTIFLALLIFYVSSLSFPPSSGTGIGYKSIIYHIGIFFFLSFFLSVSLTKGVSKNLIILSIMLSLAYAVLDEFHQSFVPGRYASMKDIFLNTFGIILSSTIIAFKIRRSERP